MVSREGLLTMKKLEIVKQHSLFKNDFFGIKRKFYKKRAFHNLIKRNHIRADKLAHILDIVSIINIPDNENDEDNLRYVCEVYDSLLEDINVVMNRVKKIIDYKESDINRIL